MEEDPTSWVPTLAVLEDMQPGFPMLSCCILNSQFKLLMKHCSLGRKLLLFVSFSLSFCLFPVFSSGSHSWLQCHRL